MWNFVDTVAKQICPICQIYQIVRLLLDLGGTESLWASHRQRHTDPQHTDSNRASCRCLQCEDASAQKAETLANGKE